MAFSSKLHSLQCSFYQKSHSLQCNFPQKTATSSLYGCLACSTDLLPVLTSTTFSPSTHHVSSSLPAYIDLVLFRIVSVLFPLLEARTIERRKKEERRKNEGRYGNNTGLIRDRYENGLFRLPTEAIDKKFNFFIIVSFDYILHFIHS